MKQTVNVKQSKVIDEIIPLEVLATNIQELSKIGKQLRQSKLTDHAIVLLIQDMTGMNKRDIRSVLDALPLLEETYVKKAKK